MTDRDFWLLFRRALLMMASAIEKRYTAACVDKQEATTPN